MRCSGGVGGGDLMEAAAARGSTPAAVLFDEAVRCRCRC